MRERIVSRRLDPGKTPESPDKPAGGAPAPGAGLPLPIGLRNRMEQSFRSDFSAVRIHESPEAAALGANAFTQGTDIHFAPGTYTPDTPAGDRMIAHELAHVVQQREGRVVTPPDPQAEAGSEATE